MATKLRYEELTITPELARDILDNHANKNNRSINRANVLQYARTMKEGKWTLDGEHIIFDSEGTILNGHHRLLAVIEAGVPVDFSVTRGADPSVFPNIDNGRPRTAGDVFKMKSIENYSSVSSIVKRFLMLNEGRTIISGFEAGGVHSNSNRSKLSNNDILSVYEQHAEEFQEFCNYAMNLRNCLRLYNVSEIGGLVCYLHMTLGYGKETIYRFFNILFQYKTSEDYPLCKEVREAIIKASLAGYRLTGTYKQAILAEAWNNFASCNKQRKRLNIPLNTKSIEFK